MGVEAYTVRPGDTLSTVAERHFGRASLWPQIFAYNATRRDGRPATLKDPNKLRIGQRIWLPPRISRHPPHLRNHLVYRHPAQVTRPAVSATTAPAARAQILPKHALPRPPVTVVPKVNRTRTHLNSFAFKYDLDLLPGILSETPEFEFEAKYAGQIYIWHDRQIDVLTLTNKGTEMAAKHETDTVLGQIINSGKVAWDRRTNRVTYENLMTTNAIGAPPSLTAVGVALDTRDPRPTIRAKFSSPKLEGRLRPSFLYLAEGVTITVDIRMKMTPPSGADAVPNGNFATIAPPAHNFATIAPPAHNRVAGAAPWSNPQVVDATASGSTKPWWDRPSILLPGAAVLLVATLASNVVTWGADSEVDPAALGTAAAMTARALSH